MRKKIAIVTGAASGIGKGIALDLATQNFYLILMDRDEKKLIQTSKKIRKAHEMQVVDIRKEKLIAKFIQETIKKHKKIDLLVNCAGVFYEGTTRISQEKFQEMMQTNLLSTIALTRLVANQMKKQKNGYIINLASLAGKRSFSNLGGYSTSKFGLLGFNDALHKEMLPYRVKVTAICPSIVNTPMTKMYDMPNQEKISVADIVKTVNYLLSLNFNAAIKEIEINCGTVAMESE